MSTVCAKEGQILIGAKPAYTFVDDTLITKNDPTTYTKYKIGDILTHKVNGIHVLIENITYHMYFAYYNVRTLETGNTYNFETSVIDKEQKIYQVA